MRRKRANQSVSETAESIWKRAQEREREGMRRAKANETLLRARMYPTDRYQPSWAMKNMLKALEMHKWLNTVDDWQRYYEAKYILKLRRMKSRR